MLSFVPGALAATRALAQVLEAAPLAGLALLMALLGLVCLVLAHQGEKGRLRRSAKAARRWANAFFVCVLALAGLGAATSLVPDPDAPAPPAAQEAPPCIHAPPPAQARPGEPQNVSMTRPA